MEGEEVDEQHLGHLTSRIAPCDARCVVIFAPSRPREAILEKGGSPAQAATREARLSSRP